VRQQGAGHRLIAAVFAVVLGVASLSGASLLDTRTETLLVHAGQPAPATRSADGHGSSHLAAVPAAARSAVARLGRIRPGGSGPRWYALLAAMAALLLWQAFGGRGASRAEPQGTWWRDGIRPRGPPAVACA
jgi:hypothetical protein